MATSVRLYFFLHTALASHTCSLHFNYGCTNSNPVDYFDTEGKAKDYEMKVWLWVKFGAHNRVPPSGLTAIILQSQVTICQIRCSLTKYVPPLPVSHSCTLFNADTILTSKAKMVNVTLARHQLVRMSKC